MMRFAIFRLGRCCVLAGCASTEPAVAARRPIRKTQMARAGARIAVLVEEQRLKLDPEGQSPGDRSRTHQNRRSARASDMAAKNYLAHAAPNGDTSASLLMADDAKWQGLLGENLAAQHYVKESGVRCRRVRRSASWTNG